MTNSHTAHTLINGITGMAASFGGLITTFQTQLEWWVRISGGILGVIIALITLANLIRKMLNP
jgi:hypothetical protein